MRALYTIAYPELPADASAFIDQLRAEHDPQHTIVAAHVTLLFACNAVDEQRYTAHVHEVAGAATEIVFCCRRAVPVTDGAATLVYLWPDEGADAILRLHHALYTGIMAPMRRCDIDYLPHLTLAAKPDRHAAELLCDTLNRGGLQIAGRLRRLTIGTLLDGKFVDLSHHALALP